MERREKARAEREWDRDKVREFGKATDEKEGAPRRSRSRERRRKERGKSKEKKGEKKGETPKAAQLNAKSSSFTLQSERLTMGRSPAPLLTLCLFLCLCCRES